MYREKHKGMTPMVELCEMSNDELSDGIRDMEESASNTSSHGQADDYVVGMFQLAHAYKEELRRRDKENKHE